MSHSFDAQRGLIVVRAEVFGPSGSAVTRLALDTGATGTLINVGLLVAIGYDPALTSDRIQMTTGSSLEFAPRLAVSEITALEQEYTAFPVLAHILPPSAGIDGLLGLDFVRGHELVIDFRSGQVRLS